MRNKKPSKVEKKDILQLMAITAILFGLIGTAIIDRENTMRRLKKDGVISRAVVRYSFEDYRSRWTIICDYQVNGGAFARPTKKRGVTDKAKNCYKVGDTLQIVHSKSDPSIYWLILPDVESDLELLKEIESKSETK